MKYKIKVYSIWEFGQRKDAEGNPHQEDCTYPLPADLKDTDRTFILCDGMGGHDAGEVASATVCQAMGEYIAQDKEREAKDIFSDDVLKGALAAAFDALDLKDNGAEKKMGTTMTFLRLHRDGATIAHIGDSRVYHIRPGKDGMDTRILFETEDHSLVNNLIKIGELTREEARHSSQKNVITRAMQPHPDYRPKADIYHTADIQAGDFFYMCSDGMLEQSDMESGESLRNIFSHKIDSTERKVEILKDVTEDNRDNHTALIIEVVEVSGAPTKVVPTPKEEKKPTPKEDTKPEAGAAIPSKRMAIVEEDTKSEGKPSGGKSGKYLTLALIVAVVVGAVYFCLNYLPGCSDKDKKTEMTVDKERGERGERGEGNAKSKIKEIKSTKRQSTPTEEAESDQSNIAPIASPTAGKPSAATPATTGAAKPEGKTNTDNQKQEVIPGLKVPSVKPKQDGEVLPSDQQKAQEQLQKIY